MFGTPPPDPPPGVPELEETKQADDGASLRDVLELHRDNPSCASCHRVMDQLGFGLEQFDAIGRFRDTEDDRDIDASGEIPGGRSFVGAIELSDVLSRTQRDSFGKTAIERLMTFAIGRELTPDDRCEIEEIAKATQPDDYRIADIIHQIVKNRLFQTYEWTGNVDN